MAKKKNQKSAATRKPTPRTTKRVQMQSRRNPNLFEIMENHLKSNQKIYLIVVLALSVIFSFLSFDFKISTANDDALYIEAGYKYSKDFFGYYYQATAPLYPMILSLLIKIFGVKLFILKSASIVFFALSLYFIYVAFKDRISYTLLFISLILTAINFQFLIYASLTYTEAFSLMLFCASMIFVFKYFDKTEEENYQIKNHIPYLIFLGFVCFVLMLSRNVAIAAIGVLALFFVYRKKYIESGIATAGFVLFYLLYKQALKFIWKIDSSQFTSQGNVMLQKDAYNPQMGNETISGLFVRFWENCEIYISSRLFHILGFREEMSSVSASLTLVFIALVLVSLWLMHKKKQYALVFSTLFYAGFLGATFVSLHTFWGQTRLIMIYLPFILFNIFYLLYYLGEKIPAVQFILPTIFIVLLLSGLTATLKQINERLPIFIENLSGDPTYGYTTDWQNYIKMSRWCADNLPDETKSIAVRKAPMSFIFTEGKEFYGIYNVPTQNADSLLIPFRERGIHYMVLAELRLDPNRYLQGQFVGTMHRYASVIEQKYPGTFSFVHQEGDLEKAQLFKINYNVIDSLSTLNSMK